MSDMFDVGTSSVRRVDIVLVVKINEDLISTFEGKRSGKQMTGKFQNVLNEFEIKIGVT
jgi:hypothetical protein